VAGAAAKALFNGDASTHGARSMSIAAPAATAPTAGAMGGCSPPLAGNPLLQTADATSAINIFLSGSTLPATKTAPSAFTMAPYDWLLTHQDVADVVSFIQTSWGNTGAVATSSKVTALRRPARYHHPGLPGRGSDAIVRYRRADLTTVKATMLH
jgi:alcohol dehydrogenase (quinone), cytochrome c subunit